ncbi:MAG: hypothetical protein ACTHMB_21165 [Candidatus Binatia bacterium]
MSRVFILSPANCNGLRARWVLKKSSRSDLAMRLRSAGVSLGEVFTYLSALYFRGTLAYARNFAEPPSSCPGILIITPTAGLLAHDTLIRLSRLRGFGRVPIHVKNQTYRAALRRSAKDLVNQLGTECQIVLLGSVATGKYLDILGPIFGTRLRVPAEFVGLGDMARGGLLLRCVRENRQLNYVEVASVVRSQSQRNRGNQKIVTKIPEIYHDDRLIGEVESS